MHCNLLLALIEADKTDSVMLAAREAGATGATVLNQARGEGLEKERTLLGLTLGTQRDMLMLLVEEHLSRTILETIASITGMDENSGAGIAFQIDVEDAVGVAHQIASLTDVVEEKI